MGSITNGLNQIIASFQGAGGRQPRRRFDALATPAIVKVKVHKAGGCTVTMTVVVRSKDELVVPRSVRRRAGIKSGDRLEFKVSGGIINIIPELPTADDEYTPAQRRLLDARLAEARKGPYYGPFKTADEAIAFLGKEIRNRKRAARKTT